MKTLLTTIIAALVITGTAFAQRVNNGDPGLALSNTDSLPKGSAFERLLLAYERGTIPSFVTMKKVGTPPLSAGSKMIVYSEKNDDNTTTNQISDLLSVVLSCRIRNNGPLLDEQLFCAFGQEKTFEYKIDYETNSLKNVLNYYRFREYQKMLIFVIYPGNDGYCFAENYNNMYLSHLNGHSVVGRFPINGVCGAGYLYK